MEKPIRSKFKTSAEFNKAMKAYVESQKTPSASASAASNDDVKVVKAIVKRVGAEVKTKTNGSEYVTCLCEITEEGYQKADGSNFQIAAMRTLLKVKDENGDDLETPVENSNVEVNQEVTLYIRKIVTNDGEEVVMADISTGATDNSDEELLAMF